MKKNTSGQKWRVFAFSLADGAPVTGDAANITAKLSIDYGAATALTDTNPTETEDGYYLFDLTQAETNGHDLSIYPQSSTTDVVVIGCPENYVTEDFSTLATASALSTVEGKVDTIDGIVDAILVDTDTTIPALIDAVPTAAENVTALMDTADLIESGLTFRNAQRLQAAAAAGKVSGANSTTVILRNAVADSKNRITATVDEFGNRSAITTDLT